VTRLGDFSRLHIGRFFTAGDFLITEEAQIFMLF
jgi:hypothetical protein